MADSTAQSDLSIKNNNPRTPTRPPLRPGRILLTLVALLTSTGCYLADWNDTHIYNPSWPPHAKFHNGQTMSMGLLLGLATLWYVWRPPPPPPRSLELRREGLDAALLLASLYWVTQLSAVLYPDARPVDPPGDVESFPQLWISGGCLMGAGVGWWLERRALGSVDGVRRSE